MKRMDGRTTDQLRAVSMQPGFISTAAGSCLIACGGTRVLCTASVEERQPPFLKGSGMGWITAEYAMLPASTGQRKQRDGIKKDGRGVEIGRLIGRALRKAVDMSCLGPRTITLTVMYWKRTGVHGRLPLPAALSRCARRSIL